MRYIISKKINLTFMPLLLCITTISNLHAASYNTKTGGAIFTQSGEWLKNMDRCYYQIVINGVSVN